MSPVPAEPRAPTPMWDPPAGPPPAVPPVAPPVAVGPARRRPGRSWFWTALGLMIGATVLLLAAAGGALVSLDSADARRGVGVPGERSFTLESGNRYTVYVVRPDGMTGADPEITLVAPDGNEENLAEPLTDAVEVVGGEESDPYGDLTVFETGSYTLRADSVPGMAEGTRVTIGNEVDTGLENVGIGLFVLGVLLGILGVVFGLVWLVVRSHHRVTAGT